MCKVETYRGLFNRNINPDLYITLFLTCVQITLPYTSQRGRVAPGLVMEQTGLSTGDTQIYCIAEDSVRCQARDKQKSSGWI